MQGHIRKRTRINAKGKETVIWYVVFDTGRDQDNKRKQKWIGGFSTRKEAEAARAKTVNEINRGSYVLPTKVTLREWLDERWLPMMRTLVKASTWDSYNRNLNLHVLPRIGDKTLRDVTAQVLNDLYAALLVDGKKNAEGGLSAKTVRYIHTTLHKALGDAIDAELVATNAADRARPPKPRASATDQLQFWTAEELNAFLQHVKGTRLETAWRVSAMTGMRRGEVLGLRWSDIDFDMCRLSVRNTIVSVNYKLVQSTPKTHKARVIDLDAGTLTALREHKQRQQGVPVKVISERLGHETPAFTLKQYAHVIPGMQAEAAAQIASLVFGGASDDCDTPPSPSQRP